LLVFSASTGFTQKVSDLAAQAQTKIGEFDQKYAISETAKTAAAAVGEKVSAIDAQYHISEKAAVAAQSASVLFGGLARTASASLEALASQASQAVESRMPGTISKVKGATDTINAVAINLTEETKAKISAQQGQAYQAVPTTENGAVDPAAGGAALPVEPLQPEIAPVPAAGATPSQ